MGELGVSLSSIDTVVSSHLHVDHVGWLNWMRRRTFSLGNHQLGLRGKRVFVPEPMRYPDVETVCSPDPTVVAAGVATIGTIRAQLYRNGCLSARMTAAMPCSNDSGASSDLGIMIFASVLR